MPPAGESRDWVFYDGACGLCHGVVRFLLARDRDGGMFRFAPLQGETFRREVPQDSSSDRPDSVVVKTAGERLLCRTEAIAHLLRRLGRPWPAAAALMGLVPSRVLDLAYDAVAASRNRLFRRPAGPCPVVPDRLRSRFSP